MTTLSIYADIYLRYNNDDEYIYYSSIESAPISQQIPIYNWPVTLTNTNVNVNVNVLITNDLVLNYETSFGMPAYQYFIIGSPNITIDGQNNTVTYNGITGAVGFVQNGANGSNGYNNIIIQNLGIVNNNSTLTSEQGWIGQSYMNNGAQGCIVQNCYSTGSIGTYAGGIFGSFSSGTANYCYSTGSIGEEAGGIFGSSSNGTANNCYSTGSIGIYSGGISGSFSSGTANNCYSTGSIDEEGGGIFGSSSNGTADNCYSTGSIGLEAGGIFGAYSTDAQANYCYSTGSNGVGGAGGGIIGAYYTNGNANNCYSTGHIGEEGGGIFGSNSQVPGGEAYNCYSTGSIGEFAGGIFGSYSSSGTAQNCYTIGDVFAHNGYGIFGGGALAANTNNSLASQNSTWSDSQAIQYLIDGPSYTNGNLTSQGTTWTDINSNNSTPWLLSKFNQELYYPNSTYFTSTGSTAQGIITSGVSYQIIQPLSATNSNTSITIDSTTGKINYHGLENSTNYTVTVLMTTANQSYGYYINTFTLNQPLSLSNTTILENSYYNETLSNSLGTVVYNQNVSTNIGVNFSITSNTTLKSDIPITYSMCNNGSFTISVEATYGSTPIPISQTFTITVLQSNITLSPKFMLNNTLYNGTLSISAGDSFRAVSVSCADPAHVSFIFSFIDNTITSDQHINITSASFTITVQGTDNNSADIYQIFMITVLSPSITLLPLIMEDNTHYNGILTNSLDSNTDVHHIVYSVLATSFVGSPSSIFSITSLNKLKSIDNILYSTCNGSFTITIQAAIQTTDPTTDQPLNYSQSFTINMVSLSTLIIQDNTVYNGTLSSPVTPGYSGITTNLDHTYVGSFTITNNNITSTTKVPIRYSMVNESSGKFNISLNASYNGNSTSLTYPITVLPPITLSPLTMSDNTTYSGTLSTGSLQNFIYSVVSTDKNTVPASIFSITSNTLVSTIPILYSMCAGSFNLTIQATDNQNTIDQTFTITVLPPVMTRFNLTPLQIDEGVIYNGTLTSDSTQSTSYSIINQPYQNLYISGDTLIARYPFSNYLDNGHYDVKIQAISSNVVIQNTFRIIVNDVPQPPTDITISNDKIPEDSSIDTLVGKLDTTDPDTNDFFKYKLVPGNGSEDNSSFTLVNSEIYTNTTFNYFDQPVYHIRIKSTDRYGYSIEIPLKLYVVLPVANDMNISALLNTDKIITLNGTGVSGKPLIYTLLNKPQYGNLKMISNGVYNYLPLHDNIDSFNYIVSEGTMTSLPGTVIINNFSQSDIDHISKQQGTFYFDKISFDGDIWTFGTMRTENFFEYIDYNAFGNWRFYKNYSL
jgi:hypothetical protein